MSLKPKTVKFFAYSISLILMAQPVAISATESQRGTLPTSSAGLNPAQARTLRAEITRLATRLDLREDLLTALARILEVDLRGAGFERLIAVLQTKAEDARVTKREIVALRVSLASARRPVAPRPIPTKAKTKGPIAGPPVRPAPTPPAPLDPAEQLLAQAEAAFDAGRLDEADRLLARLAPLRGDRLGLDLRAWQDVVQTRGKVMALAGRAQAATDFLLDAEAAYAELSRQARLAIIRQAADTLYQRGFVFGGTEELAQAADIYSARALPLAPRDTASADWASLQNDLGNVLWIRGARTGGADGEALMEASARAHESALGVFRQRDMLTDWAMTQVNLGNVLQFRGELTGGTAGLKLLAASMRAYQSALGVITQRDMPVAWAATQNSLGGILRTQGAQTRGTDGLSLLAASLRAYRSALSVYTERDMPAEWATIQNNVGDVLITQVALIGGVDGLALVPASVRAYQSALSVRTQRDMPAAWAATQNNLGNALRVQGELTGGADGLALLASSVRAFESVLSVRTPRDAPALWAMTQENMSIAYSAMFGLSKDLSKLVLARNAAQAAMTVYEGGGMEAYRQRCAQLLERIAAAERGG